MAPVFAPGMQSYPGRTMASMVGEGRKLFLLFTNDCLFSLFTSERPLNFQRVFELLALKAETNVFESKLNVT